MALKRIQDLDAAATLDGTELVELEQAGGSVQATTQDIANLAVGTGGDVTGPASSTDGNLALFDGATGKLLKDGGALGTAAFDDSGDFATAAQGALADSATQPGDLAAIATSGDVGDLTGFPGGTTDFLRADGTFAVPSGAGNVAGPGSSVSGNFALFDGTTGALLQDGGTPGGLAFIDDAPSDGTGYVRKDGAWAAESGGGSDNITIVTEASTSTMDPATHSGRSKLILAADDVTFDSTEGYTAGDVFNICATSALDLLVSGVTLTPPSGGTTGLSADMTVSVVMTSSTVGRIIGQTVAA